jgi:mRNA interferase MazF
MRRGEIWWASLMSPRGSEPGYRRPVLVVQADPFNQSRIRTVVCVAITSNMRLAAAPGNVVLKKRDSGLAKDSVINVSQIVTLDRATLTARAGTIRARHLEEVDSGLRLVLGLPSWT